MSPRLAVGDVFVLPVGDGRAGVGQIVGTYGKDAYYFSIFDAVMPLDEAPDRASEALTARLLLLALSMDAKLHAGHWTVAMRASVAANVPLPAYKEDVGFPPRVEVVDYSGTKRRPATPVEAETLPNRKIVAPVRLEKALRASLGLEPWLDIFDELRAEGNVTTAEIFG
jgi:hypothetical protein